MSDQITDREAHLSRAIAAALGEKKWRSFASVARTAFAIAEKKRAETLVELFPGYTPQDRP